MYVIISKIKLETKVFMIKLKTKYLCNVRYARGVIYIT